MSDTMRPGDTGQVDAVRAGRRGDAADDRPQVLAYGPYALYPDPYAPSATGFPSSSRPSQARLGSSCR